MGPSLCSGGCFSLVRKLCADHETGKGVTREEEILKEWEQGQTEYIHPNNRERALGDPQESGEQGNGTVRERGK